MFICGSTDDSRRTGVAAIHAAMAPRGPDDFRRVSDYFSGVSLLPKAGSTAGRLRDRRTSKRRQRCEKGRSGRCFRSGYGSTAGEARS
jgi:hypothetical protein